MSVFRAFKEQRRRQLERPEARLISRGLRWVGLIMAALATLWAVVGVIASCSLLAPHTAGQIVEHIDNGEHYLYTAEAVHTFTAGGGRVREDRVLSLSVDTGLDHFELASFSALPQTMAIASDGKAFLRNSLADQRAGRPWRQINNVCAGQAAPSARLAALPDKELIAAGKPRLLKSRDRLLDSPVWKLSFEPSARLVEQMLLLPLLERASTTEEYRFAISTSERRQIRAGRFEGRGLLWVTRKRPYRLAQLEVELALASGRRWHLLSAMRAGRAGERPLAGLDFGKPLCS